LAPLLHLNPGQTSAQTLRPGFKYKIPGFKCRNDAFKSRKAHERSIFGFPDRITIQR
jgi:hypothetical protein